MLSLMSQATPMSTTTTRLLIATTVSFLAGVLTTFVVVNSNNDNSIKRDSNLEKQNHYDVSNIDDTNDIDNSNESTEILVMKQQQDEATEDFDNVNDDCRMIRKAETVLLKRTSALCIVIERCTNDHNYSAIIRTAEALGIQHIHIIDKPLIDIDDDDIVVTAAADGDVSNLDTCKKKNSGRVLTVDEIETRKKHRLFAQNATDWITIHEYKSTTECIQACRDAGYAIWVTDLSQCAVKLTQYDLQQRQIQQNQQPHLNQQQQQQQQQYWPIPEKLAICMGTEAVGASAELLDNADVRCYIPLFGFADSLNLSVATAMVVQLLLLLQPNFVENMSAYERDELRTVWYPKLASQRLLTSREKKRYKQLQLLLQYCHTLKEKSSITPEQKQKVAKLTDYENEYTSIQEKMNISLNDIQELINNPPKPFTDIRRCNDHRITFAGKNIKKLHKDDWSNNVGIQKVISPKYSTAQYFRSLVT